MPLAYALARLSESLLFGVKAGNPSAYVLGLGLIAAVALAACWIPARRRHESIRWWHYAMNRRA